jgi:hypothetical protein
MIPNIIHFIWLTGPDSRPFNLINMVAVKAASDIQRPDRIIMHTNEAPVGNPYWDEAAQFFEVQPVKTTHPDLPFVQYRSDVLRLEILREHGGIYLDTDSLLISSLMPFMDMPFSLARESSDSLAMTPIFAAPGAPFIDHWLEGIPKAMASGVWAKHSVNLPHELQEEFPFLCKVWPQKDFFPFDLKRNYLFEIGDDLVKENWKRMGSAYALHVYETYWAADVAKIDREYVVWNRNCLFGILFGMYI